MYSVTQTLHASKEKRTKLFSPQFPKKLKAKINLTKGRCTFTCEDDNLIERLQNRIENNENDLQAWTYSLEELAEIEDAFEADEEKKLVGKTILDIGTDCVKPLYVALKFRPDKIIGINEDLSYSYTSDIEQSCKIFAEPTQIRFYNCSLFDNGTLKRILKREKVDKGFDFVLVSKTLHHFRTGECVRKLGKKHDCKDVETEKNCIYEFKEKEIFEKLLTLGKRVVIYEYFDRGETDDDKVRGRGGYFIREEWERMFRYFLQSKYNVKFIRPEGFSLCKETLDNAFSILRRVNTICFYVESKT
jgi:hypothetical protein